ncbi:MAG: UDP-glucose/GDP-mannose dehydrogenase family protein, partial [Candidatus Kerfeldbacteria bacterium]|nr:UDP-glucose/GDP-mannose dehydrogenase family protein [Candidatus Kerfeldbacteria bacterium]
IITDLRTAEMIKYASNAFLATKISFINEIANVCERVGADVDVVAAGMGMDTRIGRQFLKAGLGYGGSCFPKDVRALNQIAGTNGYTFRLLRAVIEVNNAQRLVVLAKLRRHLGTLRGKRIGVLGLAFKQETDDVRESAAVDICRRLLHAGARVRAYDPVAASNAAAQLGTRVRIAANPAEVARGADALVVATEWDLFRTLNWRALRQLCRRPLIVDGRNILDRAVLERAGFTYEGIGR